MVKSNTKLATNAACPWSPDISCEQANKASAVQAMGYIGEPLDPCKDCTYSEPDKPKSQRDRDAKTVNVVFPKKLTGAKEWPM